MCSDHGTIGSCNALQHQTVCVAKRRGLAQHGAAGLWCSYWPVVRLRCKGAHGAAALQRRAPDLTAFLISRVMRSMQYIGMWSDSCSSLCSACVRIDAPGAAQGVSKTLTVGHPSAPQPS